jgi:hypothetical protein
MDESTEITITIKKQFNEIHMDLSVSDGQEIRAMGVIDPLGTDLGAIKDLLNTGLDSVFKYL